MALHKNYLKNSSNFPQAKGLYNPAFEHDNCGVGFIARIDGKPTHTIIDDSITILLNLEHRGAVGSDKATGDGAGLLLQIPDLFLRLNCLDIGIKLPEPGDYGVAMVFLPQNKKNADYCMSVVEKCAEEEHCEVLGWREVPVSSGHLGELARSSQPQIRQLFLSRCSYDHDAFERKLYVIRRLIENEINVYENSEFSEFYITSMSGRTINYKGYMNGKDLPGFYTDLNDKRAMVEVLHADNIRNQTGAVTVDRNQSINNVMFFSKSHISIP